MIEHRILRAGINLGEGETGRIGHPPCVTYCGRGRFDRTGTIGRAKVTVEPKDVEIPSRPQPTPVRLAFFEGPDGEVIELFHNETT